MRIVQQLEAARTAVQAGAADFMTPENSACIAGVGYWHAIQETLTAEFPETDFTLWVCCGENAAIAHDALRVGLNICFKGSAAMYAKLHAIADAQGVKILDKAAA